VNPAQITSLYDAWQGAGADSMQAAINDVRNVLQSVPMIPALKRAIAHYSGDMGWNRLRPPLTELTAAQEQLLLQGLEKLDFGMPGIREAALA
jgi:4-hydroxy-tetrahydrodipicolinate synthase